MNLNCELCGKPNAEAKKLFGRRLPLTRLCKCHEPLPAKRKPVITTGIGTAMVRCACGWEGHAMRRTKQATYRVVDCSACGAVVQPLTAAKQAAVERDSGRDAHANGDIVRHLLRTKFARVPSHLRDLLHDAGMEGLVRAMIGWDESRGIRFRTYATAKVVGAMRNVVRDMMKEAKKFSQYAELVRVHRPHYCEV